MKYRITEDQKVELVAAQQQAWNKRVYARLQVLILRAEGHSISEIHASTHYCRSHINKLIGIYCTEGLSAITENHYAGNHRNISLEEEMEILEEFLPAIRFGDSTCIQDIRKAYEDKVGHTIGSGQIYRVLHRHGWNTVCDERIEPQCGNIPTVNKNQV